MILNNFQRTFTRLAAVGLFSTASLACLAHSLAPATVARSRTEVAKALGTKPSTNNPTARGDRTLSIAGTSAKIFDLSKDGKLVGHLAELEVQGAFYFVGFDAVSKDIKAIYREGSKVGQDEWKDVGFLEDLKKALSPASDK